MLSNMQKMKVLVIDNNPAFLGVFAKLLEIKGFDVTAETTLKAGLKHFESKSHPIVFVDVPLDNYDKNQILTSLVKNHVLKNSNVFLFSSVEFNESELNEWQKEGLFSYLKKPVKRSTIIQALNDVRVKIHNTSQDLSESQDEEATPEQLEKLNQLQKQIQELESIPQKNSADDDNIQQQKSLLDDSNLGSSGLTLKNIVDDLKSLQFKFESAEQSLKESSRNSDVEQDNLVKKKLKETLNDLSRLKNEIQSLEDGNVFDSKPSADSLIDKTGSDITKKPSRTGSKKSKITKKPSRTGSKKSKITKKPSRTGSKKSSKTRKR